LTVAYEFSSARVGEMFVLSRLRVFEF
jgi:hypothetical protein